MAKIILAIALLFSFLSCTTSFTNFALDNDQYPEWINKAYPNFIGINDVDKYEYNNTNLVIFDWHTFGYSYVEIRALINPEIQFKKIHIYELTLKFPEESVTLVRNKTLPDKGKMFMHIANIRYKQYFKNTRPGECELIQIYKFDNGPVITEVTPYKLTFFDEEYNPLDKYVAF